MNGTIFNDMPGQFHSQFSNKGEAWLFLYSPRLYGTQVLRPYSYQISGNALDRLVYGGGGNSSMSQALNRKEIATHPDVAGSIQPTANGTPLDMSMMGQLWTFVLQIDITSPWLGNGSAVSAATARRRLVYSGVCLDEPLSMVTMWNGQPTPNENCLMRFTHMMETVVDPAVRASGAVPRVMVRTDMDIVDSALDQQATNKDLYLATPDKMLSCQSGSGVTTEGLAALGNMKTGQGVVSSLKSPLAHFRQLLMGLDQQVNLAESATGASIANHMTGSVDPFDVDDFKQGVIGEWGQLSSPLSDASGNIDASDITRLGYILKNYPNITIVPQQISQVSPIADSNIGVVDQEVMNPKVVYSSMVAASVSALANNFGFSLIDFSYDSFCNSFDTNREGSFEVHDAHLLLPPNDPEAAATMLEHGLSMFHRQLITDLIPALKASKNGDFQMHVAYAINAETYVDLNFYDYAQSCGGGFYETTNRIANVGSTSVADSEQFIHNGAVLDSLVHSVYGRNVKNAFGNTAFEQNVDTIIDACAPETAGLGY